MKIGYACLTRGVRDTSFRTCRLQNATDELLREIIGHNLESLERIIDYNIKNNIRLYRITSDLIPFGSHEVNNLKWWDEFSLTFKRIAEKISESEMRVTMHPGQYTVLNSKNKEVVEKSVKDLEYHKRILDSLNTSLKSKIILHIGGVYGDKNAAVERFIESVSSIDVDLRNRIVIENDDKSFNIEDVLGISRRTQLPVVFDNLHNSVLSSKENKSDNEWIKICKSTWRDFDGTQKIHYSQQDTEKKPGAHSNTIDLRVFRDFVSGLDKDVDLDMMLEVKDKNMSAIKCINALSTRRDIRDLEREWARYKYIVLEKNQNIYKDIRSLLKDKDTYPVLEFYSLIDSALESVESRPDSINAALHVWGYFKDKVTDKEKEKFMKLLDSYERGDKINKIKKMLWNLSCRYNESYLLNSYYFLDIIK